MRRYPGFTMKAWVGYILLGLSLFVAYQGYLNATPDPSMEETARTVACDLDPGCVLKSERPREIRADVFQRRYEWRSTMGPLHVVCRREYVFLGPWTCEPKKGSLGSL